MNAAFSASYALRPNRRDFQKPSEDRVLCDTRNGIFMVLDGVTRVHDEYTSGGSASAEVSELFIKTAHRYLLSHGTEEPGTLLRRAALAANAQIAEYRKRRSKEEWSFYPGTLGVIGLVRGNAFHYLCVGDCCCVLLRGSGKILFGRQLTLEGVDMNHFSKADRYDLVCNHPEHPLAYGLFNGDEALGDLLDVSWIDLHPGDTLLLASDGASKYVCYTPNDQLRQQSADQILDASTVYDQPPYADYADDKSVLRIDIC